MPVYNVAMPLLARLNPDRPPFLIVEVPLEDENAQDPSQAAAPPQLAEPVVKTA
ncbi:hypothetical protein D3C83_124350 [compost metagenome]